MADHPAETGAAAAVRNIELAFAAATGEAFFRALVVHLSRALGMEYAFVGELAEPAGDEPAITTLAFCHQGEIVANITYALRGSPCEQVVGQHTCTIARGVRAAFPADVLLQEQGVESYVGVPLFDSAGGALGLLVVMGHAPLAEQELATSTVCIFAHRASAELERLRSQARVAKLEAFYEQLLNHLPLDLAVFDLEGRFQYVNPAAVADPEMRRWLIGRTEAEYCQRRGLDLAMAERRAGWRRETVDSRRTVHFEETLFDRQGREKHMLRTLVPVTGAEGQVHQLIGYGLDITDRLLAERRLRENEAVYRAMFEKNRVVKLLIDPATGDVVDANPAAAEFYGYPLETLRRTNMAAINTLPKEQLLAEMATVHGRERREFHFQHRLASGEIRDVEIHTSPLELGGRQLIFSIVRDDTERKRAEEALRQSEARYRRLFEQSKDAVLMSTPEGRLLDVNPAGLELFAYPSREAALAADFHRDFYVEPWERERLQRLLDQHGFVKEFETRFKTRQGRRLTVLGTYSEIRDEGGQIVAYLGILRDVSAERHLEEQLRQSQKMEAVGRLAGGIAHDFNNLLTAINGYSDLLLQQDPEGPLRQTYVQEIRRAGQRAAELTAKLLTLSRRKTVSPQVVDLNRVVINLEGLLHRLIGEDVELVTRLEPELGRARIDPGQIEQALLNLAVNARDAMPSGGRLILETSNVELDESYSRRHVNVQAGSYVCLAVSDTGVGIGPEVRQHVFEPFFTTKEHGKGTGLGLSTVYATVRQSEGHIALESAPGVGTTFRIYLPRVAARTLHEGAAEANRVPPLGGAETILLVEDDASVRHLLRDLLCRQGYRVLAAEHGAAALELVERHEGEIDLLLTDVVMPAMSGPELADRLAPRFPGMRILFISGYTDSIIVQHGLTQNARHLMLQKPFDARALSLKIREVLDPEASAISA